MTEYINDYMESLKQICIEAMSAAGWEYDDIDSYDDGYISFIDGDYGYQMEFRDWDDVYCWLDGVCFDDDYTTRKVDRILRKWRIAAYA